MSKRILVMEDEKDNRQIIRDMLGGIAETLCGERCATANRAEMPIVLSLRPV